MNSDDMTLFALTLMTLALIAVAVELEMLNQELSRQSAIGTQQVDHAARAYEQFERYMQQQFEKDMIPSIRQHLHASGD